MASDDHSVPTDDTQPPGREPIPPAKRKRLQQCFEHGSKQMAQENYDYATELFAQCVRGDPANEIYVDNYLANLKKKYNNNKTGSKLAQFKERGARGAVKKALGQEEWDTVIDHGLKVLVVNPWDKNTLLAMATAAREMGDAEPEMLYLKSAWEAGPKDPDICRQAAQALAERGEFDQAIAAWGRVKQALPNDPEADRAMASLAVEKTIAHGGYEDDDDVQKLAGGGRARGPRQPQRILSPEEKLRRRIAQDPEDRSAYYDLAELFVTREDYKGASEVYARAIEALGEDTDISERMEDVELRYLRQQVTQAEDKEARKQLLQELWQKELQVYKTRSERYPNDLRFKYQLGVRYQRVGEYNEAIKEFQQARNDPRRKGLCMFALGQCFQQIKQYRLAMSHYGTAIEEIPNRDAENKKECLYQAGRLAKKLKDKRTALKYLTRLAEMDFTYKDVSGLLDELGDMDDND